MIVLLVNFDRIVLIVKFLILM